MDNKKLDLSNEDNPASQKSTRYPDLKKADNPVSREMFLHEQECDLDYHNYATLVANGN